jgi:hypothetical protein
LDSAGLFIIGLQVERESLTFQINTHLSGTFCAMEGTFDLALRFWRVA